MKDNLQEIINKFHNATWLAVELDFVSWLYKYKNFLGRLNPKDFKQFDSRQEAFNAYVNNIIKKAREEKHGTRKKSK